MKTHGYKRLEQLRAAFRAPNQNLANPGIPSPVNNLKAQAAVSIPPLTSEEKRARAEALDVKRRRGINQLLAQLKETADPRIPYMPAIRAVRSHSHGYVYRVHSVTTGWMKHLLSTGEYRLFNLLDQSGRYSNIREGFGLPLDLTEAIAEAEDIKHPYNRFARENAMMSCDFIVSFPDGSNLGIDYKPYDLAQRKRVKEKFRIMALALAEVGIRHVVKTERDLDPVVTANLDLLYPLAAPFDAPPLPNASVMRAGDRLKWCLRDGTQSIYDAAVRLEPEFGCGTGRLVRTALWMIAHRHWQVDLTKPVHPDAPLHFTN